MRTFLIAACLSMVSLQAQAISRYTSTSMSCDEVKATIKREGAAIMQYQSKRVAGLPLYNRYVRDRTFCPGDQTTQTTYIPAAGGKSCPVRKCVEIEFFDR